MENSKFKKDLIKETSIEFLSMKLQLFQLYIMDFQLFHKNSKRHLYS